MIHIFLISMMISQTSLSESEKSLPEDFMNGFPISGDMRDCDYQGKRETKVKRHISREEAVEKRMVNNQVVLSKVREGEYSEMIHEQTIDEASHGRMTPPRRMKERDIKKYSMARRLGVREERPYEEKGWRLRLVDRMTENRLNATAWSSYRLRNDTLDQLHLLITKLVKHGHTPVLSKADVSKAFRRLPAAMAD